MRLYGAERLREAGEGAELARRHAGWYSALITPGDLPWWGTAGQADVLELLDAEWANVEAALGTAQIRVGLARWHHRLLPLSSQCMYDMHCATIRR